MIYVTFLARPRIIFYGGIKLKQKFCSLLNNLSGISPPLSSSHSLFTLWHCLVLLHLLSLIPDYPYFTAFVTAVRHAIHFFLIP